MTRKKINFKQKSDLRRVEQQIDSWVMSDSKENNQDPNIGFIRPTDKQTQGNDFRFTFFMPLYLHKRIKKFCVDNEISMKDKIVEILEREFSE